MTKQRSDAMLVVHASNLRKLQPSASENGACRGGEELCRRRLVLSEDTSVHSGTSNGSEPMMYVSAMSWPHGGTKKQ